MLEDCALRAVVVWLRFVPVKYSEVSGLRLRAACCTSGAGTVVAWSLLEHVLLPGSHHSTTAVC